MDGLWDDYLSTDLPISIVVAAATALAVRFRMWMRGELHEDAPMLRQFVAYLLAYLVAFAAIRGLEGATRYVVIIAAAALAFGVTLNGPAPLWSPTYARNVGIALCGVLVLLGICAAFMWFGVDLAASRNPYGS